MIQRAREFGPEAQREWTITARHRQDAPRNRTHLAGAARRRPMMQIPAGYDDLFRDDTSAFLVLATVRAHGAPVIAPVWFVMGDDGLYFSTGRDSPKARDMRERPEVGAIVMAEHDYARYVSVRGQAAEITDPAAAGIDAEALYRRIVRRYQHEDPNAPFSDAIFRLVPERITGYDYRDYTA
jgi:nitroimidazol reductase NimA-like FMN-containing flavoprotein (pyridoxamine 5'-phosphate oxidase superfamily)